MREVACALSATNKSVEAGPAICAEVQQICEELVNDAQSQLFDQI